MSKLISATFYPETEEYVYVTDDFCRLVHDTRTGEWTLFRLPTPNMVLDAVNGYLQDGHVEAFTAPIRYVPPVQAHGNAHRGPKVGEEYIKLGTFADAPSFDAEVAVDD